MPGESWTIGELARLSGVTSRTLRHYDGIGLLEPVGTAPGGRRIYGREELVRLQQILVLRELGVDLTTIGHVVRSGAERGVQVAVLRAHHTRLLAERDRFDRLAATVAATVQSLEGGRVMTAKNLYAGFDNSEYEVEARRRWGDEAVTSAGDAWGRLGAWAPTARARIMPRPGRSTLGSRSACPTPSRSTTRGSRSSSAGTTHRSRSSGRRTGRRTRASARCMSTTRGSPRPTTP